MDRAGTIIVQTARGLLVKVVREKASEKGMRDEEAIEDLVTDASLSVLSMARKFDPSRNVTFAQFLKAGQSEWKRHVTQMISQLRWGPDISDAQGQLLETANGIISEHINRTGKRPSAEKLQELLRQAESDWAGGKGDDDATTAALKRNVRSGYSAALRDVELLLAATSNPTRPDSFEGSNGDWDLVESLRSDRDGRELDPVEAMVEDTDIMDTMLRTSKLAGLSLEDLTLVLTTEDKLGRAKKNVAVARMSAPHAQYAHLNRQLETQFTSAA
jgi:hypothetical protein